MVVMKNTEEQTIEPQEVKDTYKIAYILHFFLGAGNLLPWNAFITAIDYFAHLYPTKNVERVFSVAYMTSSLLILLVLVVRHVSPSGARVQARASSLRLRMNIGFSMFILAMMVAPTIDWTHWRSTMPYKSFLLTGVSVVVCGLADGLIGGSLIGFAGQLPKEYMQAVFAGTASSGVLVSILRVITKASLPENQQGLKTSTHFYFIVSAIILFICMICSNLLFTLPLIQNHYNQLNNQTNFPSTTKPKFRNTARKILGPTFGILSIYVVTLSIFPGFISDDNRKSRVLGDWYPILLIVVYNFSDLAGKTLTAVFIPGNKNIGKVIWACFGRVVFYPAFRVCLHGPRWLETDAAIVFLTFMLGLTNGYLTSALMILAPKSVTAVEAETVAVVMAVALGLGLVGGSVLGWLWVI